MKQHLKHIFEASSCLSRRQLRDYVADSMSREEFHAVEHHISSCPLCSEALTSIMAHKGPDTVVAIEALNTVFLNEHFGHIHPEVHLNSLSPAHTLPQRHSKNKPQPVGYVAVIAASVLLGAGLLWFLQHSKQKIPMRDSYIRSTTSTTNNKNAQPSSFNSTPRTTQNTSGGYWDTGAVNK